MTKKGGNENNIDLNALVSPWMHSNHYHCKECSAEISFLSRIPWNAHSVVRAIGICKQCNILMIEHEHNSKIKPYMHDKCYAYT